CGSYAGSNTLVF
nr:immunoglobulin light chain junction region [Macaca mulatta]